MKIKRYLARNMKEACDLIRNDLGPDAVIVSSQKIRERGIKGFFSPRKLEVTAAVDETEEKESIKVSIKPQVKDSEDGGLKQELWQIKELLKKVTEKDLALSKKENENNDESYNLRKLKKALTDIEIQPDIVEVLLQDFKEEDYQGEAFKEKLLKRAASFIKPVTRSNQKSNILAFVGPPGVGKTTTLAKLGAHFSLFNGLDIGLITIDTYRIGAVQQLQTYGDIIGVSVDVVMTPGEFKRAVEKNRKKDLVLIDTAGCPSKSASQISELKVYLQAVEPIDIYLVLSSETKDRDMMRMLNDFKMLNYSKLIFTKIDETEALGSILNAAYITGLPIAYITNGQSVPDDIDAGSPELLAELILGDVV